MKKLISLSLMLTMIVLSSCNTPAHNEKTRKFALTYNTTVDKLPRGSKEIKLWIPVPSNNTHQNISDFSVETSPKVDYRITQENYYGNKMLFVNINNPSEELKVKMTMNVTRKENIPANYASTPLLSDEVTLKSNKLITIDANTIEMANKYSAGASSKDEKATKFLEQTMKHMKYDKSGKGWGQGDFAFACDVAVGNCTDFHAYFIGLCRAKGIPAYFEIGLPLNPTLNEGATGGYHCWAYYKSNKDWVPVDISEAWKAKELKKDVKLSTYFLQSHCENRVAFSIGRDIVLNPAQQGESLNYFIAPYAEVDGKKFDGISRKTTFKNLN